MRGEVLLVATREDDTRRGSGVHLFIYIHIYNRISSIKSTCTHFPLCTARELYEEHLRNSEYTGNPCQDGT